MKHLFRTLILFLALTAVVSVSYAQPVGIAEVAGRVAANDYRVFVKDTLYRISGKYVIAGTLIIEPGTTVEFFPNSQLIDSVGGRIIADGRVRATYNNPFDPFTTVKNPGPPVQYYTGYADLDYFANANVATAANIDEPTVNASKGDNLFRVNLSQTDSRLQNLTVGKAILYKASRIEFSNNDLNLNLRPWRRVGDRNINVVPGRILFRGRAANNFSYEYGHIIVLPGARAAYFRDVDFQNFRKDVTVDRMPSDPNAGGPFYFPPTPAMNSAYRSMNERVVSMTSGSGGALTSFSARTWMVNCAFENNFARYHGGAVQLLQAPLDNFGANGAPAVYPDIRTALNSLPSYPTGTNPNVTDPATGLEIQQQIPQIDNLATPAAEPFTDANRQFVDDARLAVYLGRVREIVFRSNQILLSNVGQIMNGGVPVGVGDKLNEPATVNEEDWRNEAYGGALYIAGRTQMEIGLGINNGFAPAQDYVLFEGNTAKNLQPITPTGTGAVTRGARGGAVYIGDATSVIFSGKFVNNLTDLGFNPNVADYSQGGAIYVSANSPRIQIRGGQTIAAGREMHFLNNRSGRGGAIYAYLLTPTNAVNLRPSPVIGGSDATLTTRNYGYNIKFLNNEAVADGGAIYSNKRMSIHGAGGTVGTSVNYGGDHRVEFRANKAGLSGGAVSVNIFGNLANNDREVNVVRAIFENNIVGQDVSNNLRSQVRGGGAIYAYSTILTGIKAAEFLNNKAYYSNGGAIAYINPGSSASRYFGTDLDQMSQNGMVSVDGPYTWNSSLMPDARSLTRFLGNEAIANMDQMGSGATQSGDISRQHPGTNLSENGTGLGGAVYILDENNTSRRDRIEFNRVRFQDNKAYSGAVFYSDNYGLQLVLQRSLVTGNVATSDIGSTQNAISGPYAGGQNAASSDLAGAVMYGEILGPLPFTSYHVAANAIYDNQARFLIRLPDAPNTKGTMAGTGIGFGGVDTLRGNYWGRTEANVETIILSSGAVQETFFIKGNGGSPLPFVRGGAGLQQGPFEKNGAYTYTPLPVTDNLANSVADTLLQQGVVYDIFDKGTDIKTADYSNRRMARIEDFAVGIPTRLRSFADTSLPSRDKVVKRFTRNPFDADNFSDIATLQTEFVGAHPIGYPLFLEARADYSGDVNVNNNDDRAFHETVFFVINDNTGDFVRVNLQQVSKTSEVFRGRVEFVPDSITRNPLARRTAEGLANFGASNTLLNTINRDASNEDIAALQGRKYDAAEYALGGSDFRYSNRPSLPASTNLDGNNRGLNVTYFAGERYNALPVRSGDRIRVVSRTILWQEGVNDALLSGLDFEIGTSTPAPILTGDKDLLEDILPVQLRNMRFVTEDVPYPHNPTLVRGNTKIFDITARDTNLFYDPRAILNPGDYTQLEMSWSVDPASGLAKWLEADTLKTQNPPYGATGLISLKGQPSNPYIVPGGEEVTVRVRNFPPMRSTIDSLKAIGVTDEVLSRYLYIYRPYFNAQDYDETNARYLQQDTVNYGWNGMAEYKFRILVTDSIPVFTGSTVGCGDVDDLMIASVTDQLRFDLDITTDDELEDSLAAIQGWSFRYGKTAYAFQVKSIRENPEDTATDRLQQIRPIWLGNNYLRADNGNVDPLAVNLTSKGRVKARIDSATIKELLKPFDQVNNSLNTDTVVSIVVNDGHGGINQFTRRILVNFAPLITTDNLQRATEGEQYNPQLLNIDRAIQFYDPNFGQYPTFELIYNSRTGILKDPCYPEAGNWDEISSRANTPEWLKIDPISGRLYGTPGVLDAPRLGDEAETVTVLITDPYGLTHAKELTIEINAVNHPPVLSSVPPVRCVAVNESYTEDFKVSDLDLRRTHPEGDLEQVSLSVISPAGFQTNPSSVNGTKDPDTTDFTVTGTITPTTPRNADGSVTVRIVATDKAGLSDTLVYNITVSEEVDCLSTLTVKNSQGAFQELRWGTALNATSGEDELIGGIGKLDSNFCEYEIPPIPPLDVFDARWTISTRNGVLRTIVPRGSKRPINAIFQGGGDNGTGSTNYPMEITWKASEVCEADTSDYFLQDAISNGNVFKVNMRTGAYRAQQSDIEIRKNGDDVTVIIKRNAITAFQIILDSKTAVSVDPVAGMATTFNLEQNYPNPFNGNTEIVYELPTNSDVTIEVFDAMGTKVATLVNGFYTAGVYRATWDGLSENGAQLQSGMYTYRMTAGTVNITRKMILVK